MNVFTSYFIAIPLPSKYQNDFEYLLNHLKKINPSIKTVYPKTPHITLIYLDKQDKSIIPEIAKIVHKRLKLLKNFKITIKGLGEFKKGNYKILFLSVDFSNQLNELNKALSQDVSKFLPVFQLPFYPHVTLGSSAGNIMKKDTVLIRNKISKINWHFQITELVIFGADSTQSPEYQERLIDINIS